MHRMLPAVALLAVLAPATAQNLLTNGPGPGTLSVRVDGWGLMGGCATSGLASDLHYTTSAGAGPFPTLCYSAMAFEDPLACPPPGRTWLATNPGGYPTTIPYAPGNLVAQVVVPNRHYRSQGSVCGWQVQIDQVLAGPDPRTGPPVDGSTVLQTYVFQNVSGPARPLQLYRYVDADLGAAFTNDRAGASRRRDTCRLEGPPFLSNGEWLFEYDPLDLPGSVLAVSADGIDGSGRPVLSQAFEVSLSGTGHPVAPFLSGPAGFLTGSIQGDADADLLTGEGLGGDYALVQQLAFASVPPGGRAVATFRTRLTSLDPGLNRTIEVQARDVGCATSSGNVATAGVPALCVNGNYGCVAVPQGAPIQIGLAAPPGGPSPSHYILFASVGQPATGSFEGFPGAADSALWGPPIHPWGLGAFPARCVLGSWSGGGGAEGFALASSIPGAALLPTPPATGVVACGNPILVLPGLFLNVAFTLQALVVDFESRNPSQPVSVTNAVTVAVGPILCQDSSSTCPRNAPAGCGGNCSRECPTGLTITHEARIRDGVVGGATGRTFGAGTYGERFRYTFVPAGCYCIDVRERLTVDDNGCECAGVVANPPALNIPCRTSFLDDRYNTVNANNRTPCPCSTTFTQIIECRPKTGGTWTEIGRHTMVWSRAANGNISVTITPMGGMPVGNPNGAQASPGHCR